MQTLENLFEVEFNDVKKTNFGNVVVHDNDANLSISLGERTTIQVSEQYLLPISKYGKGIKSKKLICASCCWVGSSIGEKNRESKNRSVFRMVED